MLIIPALWRLRANLGYMETMLQDKEIHAVFFFTQNSSLLKKQDIRIWGNEENGIYNPTNSYSFLQECIFHNCNCTHNFVLLTYYLHGHSSVMLLNN